MRLPRDNAENYRIAAPLNHAADLRARFWQLVLDFVQETL